MIKFLIPAVSGISIAAVTVQGSEVEHLANKITEAVIENLQEEKSSDWAKRTDVTVEFYEHLDPSISIETIQPFHMDERNTAFFQGRLSHDSERVDQTINLGLGYRYLSPEEKWMLGVNTWYDRTLDLDHERFGLGVEAFGKYLTFRANAYHAFSNWKTSSIVSGVTTQEKALDGWDAELETPIPYLPWARLSAKHYEWNAINISEVKGTSVGIRMNTSKTTELTLGVADDSVSDTGGYLNLIWYFDQPNGVQSTAADGISSTAFTTRNLKAHRLDKVRRHHDIVVEQKTTGGGGIIIGRRN